MITHDQLHIENKYGIMRVEKLRISQKPNKHVKLEISCLVPEDLGFKVVSQAMRGDPMRVYITQDGEERTLFNGRMHDMTQSGDLEVFELTFTALSATHDLDIVKKRRSFQDIIMTYGELFDEIMKGYPKINITNTIDAERKIPAPLIQYDETDMGFLQRMASHFNSVIYADAGQPYPRLCVGFTSGRNKHEINPIKYKARKDLQTCRLAEENGWEDFVPSVYSNPSKKSENDDIRDNRAATIAGIRPDKPKPTNMDFYSYYVESDEIYDMGDEVKCLGHTMFVSEREIELVGGGLVCRYRLGQPAGIYTPRQFRPYATGLQLEGRVLDTIGETVKVHLEIDETQDINKAYWFPFAPPTGTIMYCMPQHGTNVSVYIPDDNEQNSTVLGCVRKNGDVCPKTGDPNTRYWGTEHGSEMMMSPTTAHLMGVPGSNNIISMDDDTGIIINTGNDLHIKTKGDIWICAEKNLNILTPKEVLANSKYGTCLNMSGETNIRSEYGSVLFYGESKKPTAEIDEDLMGLQAK